MTSAEAQLSRLAPLAPATQDSSSSPKISRRGFITLLSYNAATGALLAGGHIQRNDAQALKENIPTRLNIAAGKKNSPATQDAAVRTLTAQLEHDANAQRLNGTLAYGISGLMLAGEIVALGAKALVHVRTRLSSQGSSHGDGPK